MLVAKSGSGFISLLLYRDIVVFDGKFLFESIVRWAASPFKRLSNTFGELLSQSFYLLSKIDVTFGFGRIETDCW